MWGVRGGRRGGEGAVAATWRCYLARNGIIFGGAIISFGVVADVGFLARGGGGGVERTWPSQAGQVIVGRDAVARVAALRALWALRTPRSDRTDNCRWAAPITVVAFHRDHFRADNGAPSTS
uniref:Uncharacterized protein n=1 Tax=Plectus sambesii TaxID=2011161 RepID=A0A914XHB0_9BILA